MKKIFVILAVLLLFTSCATLFPGKSYNKMKPKPNKKSYTTTFVQPAESVQEVAYYE